MCNAKPGTRCAADTCEDAARTEQEYTDAHPNGPQVGALGRGAHVRVKAEDDLPPNTYRIYPTRIDQALAKIEAANKRLERAGITERFEVTTRPVIVERTRHGNGGLTWVDREERIELTLNRPDISYGGWTFVASVDATDAGMITRVAPGQDLGGWRPKDLRCDHCNQVRQRTATYIVRDEQGNTRQIGSGCLRPFLGVTPGALWALEYEPEIGEGYDAPEPGERDWGAGRVADAREMIALALAVSDGGTDYVSRSRAEILERASTADRVFSVIEPPQRAEDRRGWEAIKAKADEYIADGTVEKVIEAGRNIEGDGDYAENMRVVLANEHVSYKHLGLAVSAVGVWSRNQERAARNAPVAKGFVADVGEKITGTKATVVTVKHMDNPYQRGAENTLVVFRTESGHLVKWFASGRKNFKVGEVGEFTGGTVKKHDQYKDQDQTVVVRVKFEPAS